MGLIATVQAASTHIESPKSDSLLPIPITFLRRYFEAQWGRSTDGVNKKLLLALGEDATAERGEGKTFLRRSVFGFSDFLWLGCRDDLGCM